MKNIKLLTAGCCLLFAQSVFADPAQMIDGVGCNIADADGVIHYIEECEYTILANNGHNNEYFQIMSGKAQLPDGAALPDKAFSYRAQDVGLLWCFVPGDDSKTTVTPSGRVNWWCRVVEE